MKYILFILVLIFAVNANAQNDLQRTPNGAMFRVFTHNTGEKIKLNDVVTFDIIQKTDKDSVLMSSYDSRNKGITRVQPPDSLKDFIGINLMQVFPLLALNDSAEVKIPTDSMFKGHEDQRPPFFSKGSNLVLMLKILRVQSLNDAIAERNAAIAARDAMIEKLKTSEKPDADKYIASHKLILKTTPSGLKYIITKPSPKPRPQKGDTLLVNYVGRTLDDKIFDTSIETIAKGAGIAQEGRPYEPFQFIVGSGGVIPGWDEGLLLVNEGAKARFVIPSALGYGSQGAGDNIKPYSTLVFDIELVKVKPIKHSHIPVARKPLHKTAVKKTS